jgi:hypothetical protein
LNDTFAPEKNGFQGGVSSFDGVTKHYVGFGTYTLPNHSPMSVIGYVVTNSTAPGCYMTFGTMVADTETPYYLLAHRKLTWIPTNSTAVAKVPGKVKTIINTSYSDYPGRILYKNIYLIGEVTSNFYYEFNDKINFNAKSDFEVLTCSP